MRVSDILFWHWFKADQYRLRVNFCRTVNFHQFSLFHIRKKCHQQNFTIKKIPVLINSLHSKYRAIHSSFKSCHVSAAHIDHTPEISFVTDPIDFAHLDIKKFYEDIRKELQSPSIQLKQIANYYFDGAGKAIRPLTGVLIAKALNQCLFHSNSLLDSQLKLAMATEMIHIASLLHDDVIDSSSVRRGNPSINTVWGQRKAIFAGDFILSRAARIVAKIGNPEVIISCSQAISDLIQGEFMQLGSRENTNERFAHYLQKTFKKTASLIAFSCESMALLCNAEKRLQTIAYDYGKNLGIAFQLIDDVLDFVSNQEEMGKPTTVDLRLGLATAPVLFACEKFPELENLILRRFSKHGDVETAYDMVMKSDGIDNTRILASKHGEEALKHIASLDNTPEKQALILLVENVLKRNK